MKLMNGNVSVGSFNNMVENRLFFIKKRSLITLFISVCMSGCQSQAPSERAEVTLPSYSLGDIENGKILYDELCLSCHKLKPGQNKKGPQLMNIYGAGAAELTDYAYTDAMIKAKESDWTWTAETLDTYISDPQVALPETRMFSDPIPDANERTDIISYISTLRTVPQSTTDVKSK